MEEQTVVNNQVQQPPTTPTPISKKSNQWIIAGIIFVLLLVFGAIFALSLSSRKPISPPPKPPASPLPTSPTSDETANWETYTNTRYGYSIKYPSVYTLYGFDSNRNPLPNNVNNENAYYVMFRDQPIPKEYYDALPNALWIAVMSRKEFEDFKTKLEEAVKKAPCGGCPTKYTTLINGIVADVYDGYGGYTLDKIFLMEHKGRFYRLSYDRATDPKHAVYPYDISETMINTFKFTDQEDQTVCTQDVKWCSDGSYVSRQPPSCEFAKCP